MPPSRHADPERGSIGYFWILAVLLVALWVAGGGSRADVTGQVATRFFAWLALIAGLVFLPRPDFAPVRVPLLLTLLAASVVALQLVPMPSSIWSALPDRAQLAAGDTLAGLDGSWRPISLSPGATRNALSALIVPVVCLGLLAGTGRRHDIGLLRLLLALIVAGCLLGLLQFSGRGFDHPLVNDVAGEVSGNFANRNHLALFAACGCLLAPLWPTLDPKAGKWGVLAVPAAIALFALVILATGSRAGLLLGVAGTAIGVAIARKRLLQSVAKLPRRSALLALALAVGIFVAAIAMAIMTGKAVAIERALMLDSTSDARVAALPTVLEVLARYFPVGAGAGAFDPAYRISEPDSLLGPTYFNQAHNDLLQTGIDGGLAGFVLLGAGFVWWLLRTIYVVREGGSLLSRAGAGLVFLVLLASAFDYPARTPMIMAVLAIGGVWLARGGEPSITLQRTREPREFVARG